MSVEEQINTLLEVIGIQVTCETGSERDVISRIRSVKLRNNPDPVLGISQGEV
jgi:hypothetical protein